MKFSVNAEFAGRSTRCPTCKEPLVVPSPDGTAAFQPTIGRIDGAPSSLVQAGVDGGVTLAGDFATAEALSLHNLIDGKANDGARYVIEKELARGGMGAVMRAVDCDIRREVAVKYLLDQRDPKKKLRFVEEAQITGQLEHPNIVPIHELGVDADKRMFFSMKMVKGRSLAEILKALAREPARAEKEYSLGKLLGIFVSVCNALAYAHSRGVVHRDLKPANIMVGDFGEVYVMDWGLAKVLNRRTAATATGPVTAIPVARIVGAEPFDFSIPVAAPVAPVVTSTETPASSGSGKIQTSREADADLTQDGSVLGTPVYMPPEQAAGKIQEIDERSDVYSMGAILYEMLTLHPPVSKDGGYWPILLRVTQGQLESPDKRAPERARAGKVPPELAAIAMKSLAKRMEDRYATVELLRKDVERFMEGRSVSAKPDTIREMAVKLVKRNRGVSIATAAAAVVLGVTAISFLVTILSEKAATTEAYDALRAEQKEKREQAKRSVPAMVSAAKLQIADSEFNYAMTHLNTALSIDENEVDARLLRAKLLLVRQEYANARTELERVLELRRDHREATELLEHSKKVRANDTDTLHALAEEFARQKAYTLAASVRRQEKDELDARDKKLARYRGLIEISWPGLGPKLTYDAADTLILDAPVSDPAPLCDIPINSLTLVDYKEVDLTPLKRFPLKSLELYNSAQLRDLSALKGLPLNRLVIDNAGKLTDLTPLKDMPLTQLHLNRTGISDLVPLKGMRLTSLGLHACNITDVAPLEGMLSLNGLAITWCGGLRDWNLKTLKGMPLQGLTLMQCHCSMADMRPLLNMPLIELDLADLERVPPSREMEALRKMKTLVRINRQPAAQFWDGWNKTHAKSK